MTFCLCTFFTHNWGVSSLEGRSLSTPMIFLGMFNVMCLVYSWIGNNHKCLVILLCFSLLNEDDHLATMNLGNIHYAPTLGPNSPCFSPLNCVTPCYLRLIENKRTSPRLVSKTQPPLIYSTCSSQVSLASAPWARRFTSYYMTQPLGFLKDSKWGRFSPLYSKPGNHLVLWAEELSEIVHIITHTHTYVLFSLLQT